MHGGTNPGRPIIHGRYSVAHRAALAEKMQRFLDDPQPADLMAELALMRAITDEYIGRFAGDDPIPPDDLDRIFEMLETISQLVERISKILNLTALTTAEVQLLTARLGDLVIEYVEPEKRIAFLDALDAIVGSDSRRSRARLAGDAIN